MLYTNKSLAVVSRKTSFGTITGVIIGERGYGSREAFLSTSKSIKVGEIIEEFRPDLTIVFSKSGRPRIDTRRDNDIYLILSSKREGYTPLTDGYIKTPKGQDVDLKTRAGFKRADKRIGNWDVVMVKAKNGDVFRLTWASTDCEHESTFYVVSGNTVYSADQSDIEDLYEILSLDVPFSLKYDAEQGRLLTNPSEWEVIQH